MPGLLLQPSERNRKSAQITTKAYKTNAPLHYHIFLLVLIPFVTCIPEEQSQGHYDQGSHYGQQDNQTTVKFHLAPPKFSNNIEWGWSWLPPASISMLLQFFSFQFFLLSLQLVADTALQSLHTRLGQYLNGAAHNWGCGLRAAAGQQAPHSNAGNSLHTTPTIKLEDTSLLHSWRILHQYTAGGYYTNTQLEDATKIHIDDTTPIHRSWIEP